MHMTSINRSPGCGTLVHCPLCQLLALDCLQLLLLQWTRQTMYVRQDHLSDVEVPTYIPIYTNAAISELQWNLSIKDTVCSSNHIELCTNLPLNKGHLSIKDTVCSPKHIELCTNLPLNKGHLSIKDTVCSPKHIELCTNLPLNKGHLSIQDSQLRPNGV